MYSNILKDEAPVDAPIRQDLDLIVEQTARCKQIVGGLLNFARKNQVNLSQVNLIDFVKESIKSILKPDNITINFISELTNPIINIDTDQMMQVLTNMEKNAVEAMSEGGTLTLKLTDDENNICIHLSDTGTGISKENMEFVFTPFFTTKGIGKGTGLGLPLVYGIVKMHKGKVDIISNADATQGPTGTTFKISLPRNTEEY
jgi:signal transduction histidine kinase